MADLRRQSGGGQTGGVDVTLHLTKRDGPVGQCAVGVEDRVDGILPALVREPLWRVPAVLDEAIAVGIAGAGDPIQGRFDMRPKRSQELAVRGAVVVCP